MNAPPETPSPVELRPVPGSGGRTRSGSARIDAIDALRGLVIALMVLDHTRDFFHRTAFTADPLALDSGDPVLFLTRWITHLCAPTFVFLAGLSVWLQKASGKTPAELSRFLLTRGLWLIILEFTVIGLGFNFGWWLFAQVIWAIGLGLILLAGLHRLPPFSLAALGLVILVGQGVLASVPATAFGVAEPLWRMLAIPGPASTALGFLLVAYPAIPWLGIVLLGYGLGGALTDARGLKKRRVLLTAGGCILVFAIGRGLNLDGFDPRPWTVQDSPLWTLFAVINTSKYPPSAAYGLITLGLALLLLAGLDRWGHRVAAGLRVLGRTSLFTYLIHIWLAHGLALAVGVATGVPASAFLNTISDPGRLIAQGWGFGHLGVYVAWAVVMAILFPLSLWFDRVKRDRRDRWLGYL